MDLLAEAEAGAYPARRYRVTCEPGDETNEAASVVTASCTLRQIGDLEKGTFNTSTKTFTPDSEA